MNITVELLLMHETVVQGLNSIFVIVKYAWAIHWGVTPKKRRWTKKDLSWKTVASSESLQKIIRAQILFTSIAMEVCLRFCSLCGRGTK